jgi:outer membrane protein OmpA-like peptidoglycan-associated protein
VVGASRNDDIKKIGRGMNVRLHTQWKWVGIILAVLFLAGCQHKGGLTAEQIAVLKEQGFHQTDEGWMFGLSEKVLFGNNKSNLTPESTETVKKMGKTLAQINILHARLDGFTDNYGDESYNQQLSLKRANTVADALSQGGIPRMNLTTRGMGESHPIASNSTKQGRSENRRVAIVIEAP